MKLFLFMLHKRGAHIFLNFQLFEDVAISCPFGGEDRQGLVYIYNGYSEGLREKPSQVIVGHWAAGAFPSVFGFALRGAQDLDMNGYPGKKLFTMYIYIKLL